MRKGEGRWCRRDGQAHWLVAAAEGGHCGVLMRGLGSIV
jgi:hypothetical protein